MFYLKKDCHQKCAQRTQFCIILLLVLSYCNSVYAINEFDGYLEMVRLWIPELPPPEVKLSPEEEKEFQKVWAEVGVVSKKLISSWEELRKEDPLTDRALKALDRYQELELKYNDVSHPYRKKVGWKKFNKMRSRGYAWNQTQEQKWQDLEDRDLLRLIIWQFKFNNYQVFNQEPFSQFVKTKQVTTSEYKPIDYDSFNLEDLFHTEFTYEPVLKNKKNKATSNNNKTSQTKKVKQVQWVKMDKNYIQKKRKAEIDAIKKKLKLKLNLTDEEAFEIYISGLRKQRKILRAKKQTPTDLPEAIKKYSVLHAEADYLFSAGDTYLRITPRPEIEALEKEYYNLFTKVSKIRPDYFNAWLRPHKKNKSKKTPLPGELKNE